MNNTLLQAVQRYADAHSGAAAMIPTPIPELAVVRAASPSGLDHAISKPMACLVVQGRKQVTMGAQTHSFGAGDSLLITGHVPTVSQIVEASADRPYLSVVLELDLQLTAQLAMEMQGPRDPQGPAVKVEPTDIEVIDAALRLIRLLERPAAVPVLGAQLVREMHYWLLAGTHGRAIRQLGWPQSHTQRVARAVALMRAEYAQPLPIEKLSDAAGMSPSAFYQHFRAATSLSPLQFQKQLRLIEARRLLTAEGRSASDAAYSVGYESVQQFTREYRRMFGRPPGKDAQAVRRDLEAVAA